MFTIDKALGIHTSALELRAKRAEVIANNIANADTPNFKARDLDFKATLESIDRSPKLLSTTSKNHISSNEALSAGKLMYRTPLSVHPNGNSVDNQLEVSAYTENAMHYQATVTFLSGKLRGLMSAIRGD